MFQIKICGVTNEQDATLAATAGADAVGVNFYPRSPRYVDFDAAKAIPAALPAEVAKVGVFVNASRDELCRTHDELGLDYLQLHGDETPELIGELQPRRVIRALGCGLDGHVPLASYLEQCRELDAMPAALLVDAVATVEWGGTGRMANWEALAGDRPWLGSVPLILAGGLRPENVAAAIQAVRPQAVDTASGVESQPRKKSASQIEAFVLAARRAFAEC